MRKSISIMICIAMLLALVGCNGSTQVILDNSDKSYFVDFYTEENTVYIECILNIYNSSQKDIDVKISATDNEDVAIGLIKNSTLIGQTKDGKDTFKLKHGENEITVLFTGDYAGIYQITSRSLPRFINIEIA